MKSWYSIKAQKENEALIDIFDVIGFWGISAQDFIADLKRLGDKFLKFVSASIPRAAKSLTASPSTTLSNAIPQT